MAFSMPLPLVVVSRPSFPDYSSTAELLTRHSHEYPEETLPFWRPIFKLSPWKHIHPVAEMFRAGELPQAPEIMSQAVYPDYQASAQILHAQRSSFPEERASLWQPRVKLPTPRELPMKDSNSIPDLPSATSTTEHMLIDHPCLPRKRKHVQFINAQDIFDEPISSPGLQEALSAERANPVTCSQIARDLVPAEEQNERPTVLTGCHVSGGFWHDLAEIDTGIILKGPLIDISQDQDGPKSVLQTIPIPVVLLLRERTRADLELDALVRVVASKDFSQSQLEIFLGELDECYRLFDKRCMEKLAIGYEVHSKGDVRGLAWAI